MNPFTALKDEHRSVSTRLDQIISGRTGSKKREQVRDEVIRDLSVHAAIEEQILYPLAMTVLPDAEADVREDLEEHHLVKVLARELEGLDADDERFVAKVTVLAELISHHVEEEERDLFPELAKALSAEEKRDLFESLERARAVAPTRPHPHAPDEPPANLLNLATGLLDRIRDRVGV